MAETVYQLTREGYEKLKTERDELKRKLMGEIADKIKEARELGDLSENSEYEEAKNEQGKIDSRIKEIEFILDHAEVIEEEIYDKNEVRLGRKVKIKDYSLNIEKEFLIVTPQEANIIDNKISTDSPIGKSLIGRKKGEKISLKTNHGKTKKIEILEIS
ncbi:MAG: transcription elongation factor GreA [Thermotogae bacterium]|nr:transcription elongation factor GreA [Thermotogota bacterium]HOO74703.1 transcription elongation factor GreA [Tepiditoga sp.]